ncbi:trypsin-like peptidase domain-containing protein [Thermostilla marina]
MSQAGYAQQKPIVAIPAASERFGPIDEPSREALRQELAKHAAVLESYSKAIRIIAKLIEPAVVHIEARVPGRRALQQGPQAPVEEAGAGVIVTINDKYYVVSNRHIVKGALPPRISIHLYDGRRIQPDVLWTDPETDIAVMAISAPRIAAAAIGDSDSLEVGDFVLAFGSPFGLRHSVSFGIVSGKSRRGLDLGDPAVRLQDFLQTDAAINPGNSGGPLVNLKGEVVGINTAIASESGGSEGVGFAVPINLAMFVARQLVEKGYVERAFLGVTLDSHYDLEAAREAGLDELIGAKVLSITPGSPAEKGGIKPGDIVLRYNDVPIEDDAHLVHLVTITPIGKTVPVLVLRDKQPTLLKVTLQGRPQSG